jgi:hypothetical protein
MAFGKKMQVVIDSRQAERRPVLLSALVRLPAGEAVEVTILDLSAAGFRANIPLNLTEGSLLRIGLPIGKMPHARVAWVGEDCVGCEFIAPLAGEEVRLIAEIWEGVPGTNASR